MALNGPQEASMLTRVALVGFTILLTMGCSLMNGMLGRDSQDAQDQMDPFARQPLTGFSKNSLEERVPDIFRLFGKKEADDSMTEAARHHARLRAEKGWEYVDIYFAFDRWGLPDEEQKSLTASADFLREHPKSRLVIEGYCDERGSGDYNLVLGEKRAREARQFLSDLGVKNAVSIVSYGKERPVCTDHAESCYWQNRRAHLMIRTDR
jgi:peptidoglycan-associated lipoprotein